MAEDRVRVIRILEYVGPRSWVEKTVAKSIHGTKEISPTMDATITGVTLGSFAEILSSHSSQSEDHP